MTQSELDIDTVKVILGEFRISNADVTLRHDATAEELIDVIEGNRIYIPCIYVLNKIDQISIEVSYCSYVIPLALLFSNRCMQTTEGEIEFTCKVLMSSRWLLLAPPLHYV